jgi:hypothetical protein
MPRIPESNDRYRTKDQLCSDIAFVLNSSLHYGTKYAVLSEAAWVWTEFQGKYEGCEYWSKAALKFRGDPKRLVHEHVIPKKIVIKRLLKLSSPTAATASSVRQELDSYCKGAVITREEDASLNRLGFRSKMPSDWDEKDLWARYKAAGIILEA